MRNVLRLAFLAVLAAASSCKSKVEKCTERGVAYFKEIGSYPTLSDGRDAEKVAEERCRRTTTAFPE